MSNGQPCDIDHDGEVLPDSVSPCADPALCGPYCEGRCQPKPLSTASWTEKFDRWWAGGLNVATVQSNVYQMCREAFMAGAAAERAEHESGALEALGLAYREGVLDVLVTMREVYSPEGCGLWLYAPQERWHGSSALDLLKAGRVQEVAQAIHQLADGAFA